MSRRIVCLASVALVACISCQLALWAQPGSKDADASQPRDYQCEVKCVHDEKEGHCLEICLTNVSKQDIPIREFMLPWHSSSEMTIVVAKCGVSDGVLRQTGEVSDVFGTPVLGSGKRMTGKIKLSPRFRDFDKAVAQRDLVLFWSYELKSADDRQYGRFGGWCLIKKTT